MLRKFFKRSLIFSILLINITYLHGENCRECIEFGFKNFTKQNNLHIKVLDTEGLYYKLVIYLDDIKKIENNILLAKSMQNDSVTASALKRIAPSKEKLEIVLGVLKGNSYIETTLNFNYIEGRFLLSKLKRKTENFFTDDKKIAFFKVNKKLFLSDIDYESYFISDGINNYIQKYKFFIKNQKQYLYRNPSISSNTKMYVIKNDKVEILDDETDWYQILYRGKKDIKAWIPKGSVSRNRQHSIQKIN